MFSKFRTPNWLIKNYYRNSVLKNKNIFKGVIYDFGCGIKPYRDILTENSEKYIGVDWNNSMHDKKMDINADLNNIIPIKNEVADVIVSFNVLEHIKNYNIFLSEATRILKKNGTLFMIIPFQWHLHEEPYDYSRFTKFKLDSLLKELKYKKIKIDEGTGFWVTFVMKFNYHTARYVYKNNILSYFLKIFLIPLWFIGQILAPVLDKLDYNPKETSYYIVTANK
jgi:SAM-dependent methyltransferase